MRYGAEWSADTGFTSVGTARLRCVLHDEKRSGLGGEDLLQPARSLEGLPDQLAAPRRPQGRRLERKTSTVLQLTQPPLGFAASRPVEPAPPALGELTQQRSSALWITQFYAWRLMEFAGYRL
jgi:hypothetical protein